MQFDPAAARKLLTEAGWHPAEDGICRNETGVRLSLMFQSSAGNKAAELLQQGIQNQWKAICVETVTKNEPRRTLFGETLKKRQFTGLVLMGWLSGVSDPPRQTLGSDQIPSPANNFAGSNYTDWHNASVDAGIKVTENELDVGKRQAAWAAMQHAYADELPVLPLFFLETGVALPRWLHGYVPTGTGASPSLWVETWRAE